MKDPRYPAKPCPGDRVAVLSPSAGLPGLFPQPYELGLRRLREEFLETSEDMPRAQEVYWILRGMGERGLLRQFPALLMGRAKSWSFEKPHGAEERERYRREQREAVLRALADYAPGTMAVFDVDLGHTDPQLVIPVGGRVRVDGPARRVFVTY
ncbi:hypothetical protein OG435_37260 [Streptomyces sp. NBC_01264]|nr:hypothetical protein [Streptomyces sp. NBC_01264]MCX4782310.1 hypothetical protein [Streptomyces sp. NBC_01264]